MYQSDSNRYARMSYPRLGRSGVCVSAFAVGLWQNFGEDCRYDNCRDVLCAAFDAGVNHFDLANNYGIPAGSAEETFGRVLRGEFAHHRDELFISSKAGHLMWDGPFGDHGSKKHLIASLDQSLRRMGLDYVDIFYHHRPDPDTPIEETAEALEQIVRQGKALYIGLSKYSPAQTAAMLDELGRRGLRCLLHQDRYSMLVREPEAELFPMLRERGVGSIAFSPLAQGMLTTKYLDAVPADSRMSAGHTSLNAGQLTDEARSRIRRLNDLAKDRGQTLPQMALAWTIREGGADTLIIGAHTVPQLTENLAALERREFTADELAVIEQILRS